MADQDLYPVPAEWAARARIDGAAFEAMTTAARDDPDAFWLEQAERLDWVTAPTRAGDHRDRLCRLLLFGLNDDGTHGNSFSWGRGASGRRNRSRGARIRPARS